MRPRRPPSPLLFLSALLLAVPTAAGPARSQSTPAAQRLTYTITFMGIAVARAMLEEVRLEEGSGPPDWLARGSARATGFWQTFFHLGDTFTTRVVPGEFQPTHFARDIQERGRRWHHKEIYSPAGRGALEAVPFDPWSGLERLPGARALPPVPDRYRPEGVPDSLVTEQVGAGQHNLFSALWRIRYHGWGSGAPSLRMPMWVDGRRWRLRVELDGLEERRALGERIGTWRIRCTFDLLDEGEEATRRPTDYVTEELVREDSTVFFWIEQAPARRPIAVEVRRPGLTVKGLIREPYEDERIPPR